MTTCRRSSGARPERPATARKLGKIQTALVGSIVPVLTLIKTAKLNDVEPMAYLTDVITRVVNGQHRRHQTRCGRGQRRRHALRRKWHLHRRWSKHPCFRHRRRRQEDYRPLRRHDRECIDRCGQRQPALRARRFDSDSLGWPIRSGDRQGHRGDVGW